MKPSQKAMLARAREQIADHLKNCLVEFWAEHAIDTEYGGYLTGFDEHGMRTDAPLDKYIVIQTRMIWSFAMLHRMFPDDPRLERAAQQGVDFLINHMWDADRGGWYWQVGRDGALLDDSKVIYGHSFAIYALAEYYLATGDERGLSYASQTFNALQLYAADVARGGYYEHMTADWSLTQGGTFTAERKTLNTHMHLMEAFTTLYEASDLEIHRRRLGELIDLILAKMIHPESGAGLNQLSLDFEPVPTPDRARSERNEEPLDITSYGHNVELAWLLVRAGEALGKPRSTYAEVVKRLCNHALKYGLDTENGGIYREGLHDAPAFDLRKEWWQNAEALVGFLDAYEITSDKNYLNAFATTWRFDDTYMINHDVGEWYTIAEPDGTVIRAAMGHTWKSAYHTTRAMQESIKRIDMILGK